MKRKKHPTVDEVAAAVARLVEKGFLRRVGTNEKGDAVNAVADEHLDRGEFKH